MGTVPTGTGQLRIIHSACLVNTAIAVAGDPVTMAVAFKQAVEAGRMAYEAGLGIQADNFVAEASSPLTAFLNEK
jgi:thiazole synthase